MPENNRRHIEHEQSCGNVFEDIGLDKVRAASLTYRSQLIGILHHARQERRLSLAAFSTLVGISPARLAHLFNGKLKGVSEGKLVGAVSRLGGVTP